MAKASEELGRDDLCQASEKGWGAAAEMVKAVADERGWAHNGHRTLFNVVGSLVAETGDPEIRRQFVMAGQLHTNFYEGWLSRATVEDVLSQVSSFVERMESLIAES